MYPPHDVKDRELLGALVASMRSDGWTGAPLVAWEDALITGSHRYAAAMQIGIDVPTVQLAELYSAEGLDLEETVAELGATVGEWGSVADLVVRLSWATRKAYGIDAE